MSAAVNSLTCVWFVCLLFNLKVTQPVNKKKSQFYSACCDFVVSWFFIRGGEHSLCDVPNADVFTTG